MYHPTSLLRIAHDREAELIREAQFCGVPQVEPKDLTFAAKVLPAVIGVTILVAVLTLLVW
jgi:hypothetical protein